MVIRYAPKVVNKAVKPKPVNRADVNTDRKAYMREYMAKKRAAQRSTTR